MAQDSPGPSWVVSDENEGRMRPSSGAFKDNQNGSISAFIAGETGSAEAVLADLHGFRVVTFTLGLVRALGLIVERDETGGPGHVLLHGDKEKRVEIEGERLRVKEALALKCQWLGDPPNMSQVAPGHAPHLM